MIYKYLTEVQGEQRILARIDDDGLCRLTCTENDQAYLKFLEEGGQPLPAEENT